jgi:hypothetical protein
VGERGLHERVDGKIDLLIQINCRRNEGLGTGLAETEKLSYRKLETITLLADFKRSKITFEF